MKKIIIAFVSLLLLAGLFTMQSCTKDEVAITTKYTAALPVALLPVVGSDGTVFFTGTTVDLKWAADNKNTAAVAWDLYFGPSKSPALLASGLTQPMKTVTVADGITYYWKVETTDAEGIKTTSEVFKFTAVNGTNPKLTVNLDVTTDVLTAIGVDLAADKVVDLRFLILKKSDFAVVATINDALANEVYRGFLSLPDNEYLLAVDIKSTIDAGTINKPLNLTLSLKFAQLGIIDTVLEYPNVMTNVNSCSYYRTILATVNKVGPAYTITRTISTWVNAIADPTKLVGEWTGTDADPGYPSEVVSAITGGKLLFTGIGRGWMQDAWGEVITKEYPISMNFNYCKGTLTIANQKIQETTWNGDVQPPYYISGSGTFDMRGDFPTMVIKYDFNQPGGGGTIARYFGLPYFTLEISLDPAGKGKGIMTNKIPALIRRAQN